MSTLFCALVIMLIALFGTIGASTAIAADDQPVAPSPDPSPLPITKQALPFAELAPTTTMSFEELVGDNGIRTDENAGDIPPLPPADKYKLVVNEYHQIAAVYSMDSDGLYTIPVRYIVVSTGTRENPTVKGTFEMGDKYVRYGLFASYDVYGQYWRQITRSFFCHSIIYTTKNARSYTNASYNALGTRASHGCVRMLVPDARWIYYNLGAGTVCEIIKGDKNDTEAAAIKAQLTRPKRPSVRPKLTAGQIPVTEAWPGWTGNASSQYEAYLDSLAASETDKSQDGNA